MVGLSANFPVGVGSYVVVKVRALPCFGGRRPGLKQSLVGLSIRLQEDQDIFVRAKPQGIPTVFLKARVLFQYDHRHRVTAKNDLQLHPVTLV
jgi:hypothetical protein